MRRLCGCDATIRGQNCSSVEIAFGMAKLLHRIYKNSNLITSQVDVEDCKLCFLLRLAAMQLPCQPPQKSIMRQISWIDGSLSLGSMDEDLEIREFTKRTAHEVCNNAVHFEICGKHKGTKPTMPFIRNVVWSCLAKGLVEYCAKKSCTGRVWTSAGADL
jgi:hypothetical protein